MAVEFTRETNYRDNGGVTQVVFGASSPLLEVELNEMQRIYQTLTKRLIMYIVGDGISDTSAIKYDASTQVLTLEECLISVEGNLVQCTGLTQQMSVDDTCYFVIKNEVITDSDTMYVEGNEQKGEILPNWIMDNRMKIETSRRRVNTYSLTTTEDYDNPCIAIAQVIDNGEGNELDINIPPIKNTQDLEQEIDDKLATLNVKAWFDGVSPPNDTKLLWIDTGNDNALKFHDGTTWQGVATATFG